jgi:glycosyltransferase involved in cell wall biosynthesis
VVTPNTERLAVLPAAPDPVRFRVVPNYPLRREAALDPRDAWQPPLRLIFQGSIGPKRVPLALVAALSDLPTSVHLTIAGYVSPGTDWHMAALRDSVTRLGLGDRVRFAGVLQRGELLATLREHDLGLLLVDPTSDPDFNLRTLVGASNKAYEYLGAGLPVIVPDTPDWRAAIVDAGLGRGCDGSKAESIADAVRFFLDSPGALREMGERGRRRVGATWNYETSFAPVLSVLEGGRG